MDDEDMDDEEGENPVVEHGMPLPVIDGDGMGVDGDGMGVGTTSNGLTPALPISTEPSGIPVRAAPPGDAGDVAALLVELVPQAPDIAALPGSDVPVPVPVPPPSKVVLEPDIPDDGLPMVKHVVPFPVIPIAPAGAGLSPGEASSVAPMGIPAGGTGEPAAMPSGEVAPIPGVGLPIPPTCANAGMQPKSAACIAAINTRRIMISIVRTIRPARQQKQRCGRLVNNNIDAASVANVRPTRAVRAVRRAAPIITISVARAITAMAVIAMESTSDTAAHAGSTKVAAYAAAATRLRVGCKQAARQRGGH